MFFSFTNTSKHAIVVTSWAACSQPRSLSCCQSFCELNINSRTGRTSTDRIYADELTAYILTNCIYTLTNWLHIYSLTAYIHWLLVYTAYIYTHTQTDSIHKQTSLTYTQRLIAYIHMDWHRVDTDWKLTPLTKSSPFTLQAYTHRLNANHLMHIHTSWKLTLSTQTYILRLKSSLFPVQTCTHRLRDNPFNAQTYTHISTKLF